MGSTSLLSSLPQPKYCCPRWTQPKTKAKYDPTPRRSGGLSASTAGKPWWHTPTASLVRSTAATTQSVAGVRFQPAVACNRGKGLSRNDLTKNHRARLFPHLFDRHVATRSAAAETGKAHPPLVTIMDVGHRPWSVGNSGVRSRRLCWRHSSEEQKPSIPASSLRVFLCIPQAHPERLTRSTLSNAGTRAAGRWGHRAERGGGRVRQSRSPTALLAFFLRVSALLPTVAPFLC